MTNQPKTLEATKAASNWICGKCEQEAGKYPDGERLSGHSRHCGKRIIEEIGKMKKEVDSDTGKLTEDTWFSNPEDAFKTGVEEGIIIGFNEALIAAQEIVKKLKI